MLGGWVISTSLGAGVVQGGAGVVQGMGVVQVVGINPGGG